ncbi:hypothetical protein [Haladaptatus sp. NG-WS-4]
MEVRVHNEVGKLIVESDTVFNVGATTTIDVQVDEERCVVPSEFERVESRLKAELDGLSAGDLSDEEVA